MKKIYLSFCVLAVGFVSFGQNQQINHKLNLGPVKSETPKTPKALGQVFYHDNFDSTMVGIGLPTSLGNSQWTINNSGQSGAEFGWTIDATSDGWWSTAAAIASSSEGKFAELSNGDPTVPVAQGGPTQALGVTYTMTTTNPIDIQALAGSDNVTLSFEQFGARFNDLQQILISTNGTTWVPVGDNLDKSVLSQSGGAPYSNPDIKSINLASFIAGNANSVWIRFLWTTNYPNSATNPNVWVTYGWYIDDLKLTTNPDNEVVVEEVFIGDLLNDYNYAMIPLAQAAPMIVGVSLTNNGLNDFTAQPVNISIKLNGGEVHNENVTVTLPSAASDTIWHTTTYTPAAIGNYVIDISIPADDDLTNNTGTNALEVTNWVFGHDYGGTVARGFPNDSVATSIGNVYRMVNTQDVSAINVKFTTGTTVNNGGQEVRVAIYEMTSESIQDDLNFITEQYYTVTGADLSSPFTLIELPSTVTLTGGSNYIAFVEKFAGPLSKKLFVTGSTAGDDDFSTACYGPFGQADAENWFNGWGWSPYVRLNFDPSLAVENISMLDNVNVYPNPSTGNVTITNDNGTENTITVFDISGKQITSKTSITATTLDLSSYGSGVYVVEITNDNNKKTERVVIR